ncbi:Kinase, ULK [Spironucleus salmonicida]|uniref:Kinase, ULK n=1 Tax=Spironucleus salmonicida TaxID=348837 RepID=V6LMD7_9EUKA|nr:Kinase, ULK [Spironucleus salmonicida]|eukprot:EST45378.1 Kinase, ULK [Spironucleus salmonicida]
MIKTIQTTQYVIPEGIDVKQLISILTKYQNAKSVHQFQYKIEENILIIIQDSFKFTLADFKENQKLFTIQEAYNLITKCIYASYDLAQQNLFIGGYRLDDFIVILKKKWIKIKIVLNIKKIFQYLTANYPSCIAPEVLTNIITEKADFWSFGVLLYYLLKTKYKIHKDVFDRYSQVSFLESLQIQNKKFVDFISNLIQQDYNLRLGYIQYFQFDNEIRNVCLHSNDIQTINTSTFDQVLSSLKLDKVRNLGQGSFGNVLLVKDKTANQFALKVVEVRNQMEINQASSEACFMEQNRNNNYIIQIKFMKKVRINDKFFVLFGQEYADFGDLRYFMRMYGTQLSQTQVLKLFYDLSQALLLMKEQNMIHRDIKPENILLMQKDNKIIAKLADFGCDEVLLNGSSSDCHHLIGTPGYIAPEVLTQDQVSFSVDVWSFGVMLQEYTEEQELISMCLIEDQNQRAQIEVINQKLQIYKDQVVQVHEVEQSTSSAVSHSQYNSVNLSELNSNFTFSDFAILQ